MAKHTRKTAAPAAAQSVYCGPTIPGVAKQFTVYTNGIPPALAAATEKNPILGSLVIPLDKLPDAMRQLREGAGSIYTLYRQAAQIKNQ